MPKNIKVVDEVGFEDAPAQEEIVSAVSKRLQIGEDDAENLLLISVIPVVKVRVEDLEVQSRRDARDAHIALAEESIRNKESNPILIDSSKSPYLVLDGRHRVIASENLNRRWILALDVGVPRIIETRDGPTVDFALLRQVAQKR